MHEGNSSPVSPTRPCPWKSPTDCTRLDASCVFELVTGPQRAQCGKGVRSGRLSRMVRGPIAQTPSCDHCRTPYLSEYPPYGWLCEPCVIRQDEADNGADDGLGEW